MVRLLLIMAIALPAHALDFKLVRGSEVGIDSVLAAHVDGQSRSAWLWSPLGWCDGSGCYVQASFHNSCYGPIFKRQPDGQYQLVDIPPSESGRTPPAGSQPLVLDLDNNGLLDMVSVDDECSGQVSSMLHFPDGWVYEEGYTLTGGKRHLFKDLNGDGLVDLDGPGWDYINTGTGWTLKTTTIEERIAPTGAPQSVLDRALASEAENNRYQGIRVYETGGDWLITYGGSYSIGDPVKWTVVVRDGVVVFDSLGESARPVLIDGVPAFLLRNGKYNDINGLYRRQPDGSYVSGTLPNRSVRRWLGNGAYIWDIEAHDFDADGDDDLILEGKLHSRSYLLENTGTEFELYQEIRTARGQPIYVADIDADGDLDILNTGGEGDNGNSKTLRLWINQANVPTPDPDPVPDPPVDPVPDPDPVPTPAPCEGLDAALEALEAARKAVIAAEAAVGALSCSALEPTPDPDPDPEPTPDPEPAPEPIPPVVTGGLPLPAFDEDSQAWARFVAWADSGNGKAQHNALIGVVTDDEAHCAKAQDQAQAIVDADKVAGNQYLTAGRLFSDVFSTMAWCGGDASWAAWASGHLGEPDGSVRDSLWWSRRWSRNNPANNYYHAFIEATSAYAMATGDQKWLDFLKNDRLPLMFDYYSQTPEGGSREGTAYGESHRNVLKLAKLWRDYDGTEIVPQEFIDGTLMFWTHAVMPGGEWMALLGDQTRTHGKTDGYHKDILDNALLLATDPKAIDAGRWTYHQIAQGSAVFTPLFLTDVPQGSPPSDLAYHAEGAGVLFVRGGWTDDSTALYFTAGIRDEAHQCEDQGAFAVWDGGWQTVGDHAWTRTGICKSRIESQNVLRFPGVTENVRDSESSLAYLLNGGLSVVMDLSEAVGQRWLRSFAWTPGADQMTVTDKFTGEAVFGFEKPSEDDERAPYVSDATAVTQKTATGMETVIQW
jgi:hypothetical protein